MCKAAGRPWPVLDEDDVVDYLIAEAVATKVSKLDSDREKKRDRDKWKKDTKDLDHLRN